MEKKNFWNEYFSIPNILGYIRLILACCYLFVCYRATSKEDYYVAGAIIGISMITDFLDGKIARHFHMITDWGKILDPVADKVTLGVIVLSFLWRYPFSKAVFIVLIGKEGFMFLAGLWLMKQGWRTSGAIFIGKVCTAMLYLISILLLLIPNMNLTIVNGLFLFEIILMILTLLSYMKLYYKTAKQLKV